MSIYPPRDSGPAAVVSAAREKVLELGERLSAGISDDELLGAMEAIQQLNATVAATEAKFLAELDFREVPKRKLSWGSTADWFTHLAGVHRREGHRRVRIAKKLVVDQLATLAALQDGTTSLTQAGVICDAVDKLPGSVQDDAEGYLIEQSKRLNATELARAGRHITEVVDPEGTEREDEAALDREERAAHLNRFLSVTEDGAGGVYIKGRGSVEDGEKVRSALLPLTKPEPAVDPHDPDCSKLTDPRDHGARMWDALVTLVEEALAAKVAPESHGAPARVSVTIPLEDLKNGYGGPATTEGGLDLSPATVRRMACDAEILPIVLGSDGRVLDVGRCQRLVTLAIWTALLCRDLHCTFPGCTRPPLMCHAHHIIHWVDGGPTSLDNMVILCGEHHRVIHNTPWQVRLSSCDGKPEFLPPPRRGEPATEWIRHRPRRE